MKITQANADHIKNISSVYIRSWHTTYRGLLPDNYLNSLSYEKSEQKWRDFFSTAIDPFIYVAINQEGQVVGFAAGKSIGEENFGGELYSLYLLQECRGLGVGRQLVSAVAKHLRINGIDSMLVWVMKKNQSGRGFYERIGGEKYKTRTSTFGNIVVDDVAYGWQDVSVLFIE